MRTLKTGLIWCQLCCHLRHYSLLLWPVVPSLMAKLASWWLVVFSEVMISIVIGVTTVQCTVTGGFPSQSTSNAANASTSWHHHEHTPDPSDYPVWLVLAEPSTCSWSQTGCQCHPALPTSCLYQYGRPNKPWHPCVHSPTIPQKSPLITDTSVDNPLHYSTGTLINRQLLCSTCRKKSS